MLAQASETESEEEMDFRMGPTGKPLADLQAEVEREQCVYPSTNHDVFVTYVPEHYLFYRFEESRGGTVKCYNGSKQQEDRTWQTKHTLTC